MIGTSTLMTRFTALPNAPGELSTLQRGRELFEKQNSAVGRKNRVGAGRALDLCYCFLQTLNGQR